MLEAWLSRVPPGYILQRACCSSWRILSVSIVSVDASCVCVMPTCRLDCRWVCMASAHSQLELIGTSELLWRVYMRWYLGNDGPECRDSQAVAVLPSGWPCMHTPNAALLACQQALSGIQLTPCELQIIALPPDMTKGGKGPLLACNDLDLELIWQRLQQVKQLNTSMRETIRVPVTGAVDRGMLVQLFGIKGFVPVSHVPKMEDEDWLAKDDLEVRVASCLPRPVCRRRRRRLSHLPPPSARGACAPACECGRSVRACANACRSTWARGWRCR
jgi:hypothetical protein